MVLPVTTLKLTLETFLIDKRAKLEKQMSFR